MGNLLAAENAKCSLSITPFKVPSSPSTPVIQRKGVVSPRPTEVGVGRIHSRRPRGLRADRRKFTMSLSLEAGTTRVVWSIERGIVEVGWVLEEWWNGWVGVEFCLGCEWSE
jgi:hypothetical protein